MAYQVQLDNFHGPLDLLLYLVKKEELDVLDIPIARLTDQFLEYLHTLRELDVELAGDFLVTAATLMEIKCASLIAETLEEDGEEALDLPDPRKDLVRQLQEYRRFRDAMLALEECAERSARCYTRSAPPSESAATAPAATLKAVELWDLVSAFARILRETQTTQSSAIVQDDTPQAVHEASILDGLKKGMIQRFDDIFHGNCERSRLIGLFLALLELVKRGTVQVRQEQPFGVIFVSLPVPAN